jgi:hypothetical protein
MRRHVHMHTHTRMHTHYSTRAYIHCTITDIRFDNLVLCHTKICRVFISSVILYLYIRTRARYRNRASVGVTGGSDADPDDAKNTTKFDNFHAQRTPVHDQATFVSAHDKTIMQDLYRCQNTLKELLSIALPAAMSIGVCPFTIFLHGPMVSFLWGDSTSAPNVNDSLACYLVPAGMVYAISFGFALQGALEKQTETQNSILGVVSTTEEVAYLIGSSFRLTPKTKVAVWKVLKSQMINNILLVCKKPVDKTGAYTLYTLD